MNRRSFTSGIACAALGLALGVSELQSRSLSAEGATQQKKTVDQTRKNIQAYLFTIRRPA